MKRKHSPQKKNVGQDTSKSSEDSHSVRKRVDYAARKTSSAEGNESESSVEVVDSPVRPTRSAKRRKQPREDEDSSTEEYDPGPEEKLRSSPRRKNKSPVKVVDSSSDGQDFQSPGGEESSSRSSKKKRRKKLSLKKGSVLEGRNSSDEEDVTPVKEKRTSRKVRFSEEVEKSADGTDLSEKKKKKAKMTRAWVDIDSSSGEMDNKGKKVRKGTPLKETCASEGSDSCAETDASPSKRKTSRRKTRANKKESTPKNSSAFEVVDSSGDENDRSAKKETISEEVDISSEEDDHPADKKSPRKSGTFRKTDQPGTDKEKSEHILQPTTSVPKKNSHVTKTSSLEETDSNNAEMEIPSGANSPEMVTIIIDKDSADPLGNKGSPGKKGKSPVKMKDASPQKRNAAGRSAKDSSAVKKGSRRQRDVLCVEDDDDEFQISDHAK